MKNPFLYFSFVWLVLSCSKDIKQNSSLAELNIATKAQDTLITNMYDTTCVFSFDSITAPSNWRTYESFAEKEAACQIPDSILHQLPSEKLYRLCVDYPLGTSCFYYNDYQFGFDRIMNAFNGYTELKCRRLRQIDTSVSLDKSNKAYYLRLKFKKLLDSNLISCDKRIKERPSRSYTTARTYYGKAVDAIIGGGDLTEAEIQALYFDMQQNYPNAIIIGNATRDYNCHGYAWSVSNNGLICWIYCGTSVADFSNISKYWTNDAYVQTALESEALKIHYYEGDHSAVKSSVSGYYESKWGSGFLVRHLPGDCPYSGDRHYYKGAHYVIQCIQGSAANIPLNSTRGYYLNPFPMGPDAIWSWDVESDKTGESVVGQYATITTNASAGFPSVNITISHAGSYDIICRFCNPYRTEEWRYQVFVDPDEE